MVIVHNFLISTSSTHENFFTPGQGYFHVVS